MNHRVAFPAVLAALSSVVVAVPVAGAELAGPRALPAVGGLPVPDVTGTVGGVVDGVVAPVVGQTLDGVLAGGSGVLPADLLDATLAGGPGAPGAPGAGGAAGAAGAGGAAGAAVGSGASSIESASDRRAPVVSMRPLARLRTVAERGRLRLEVRSDEAGVVALTASLRPGALRRGVRLARGRRHDRSIVRLSAVVLTFRSPGALVVSLPLSRADRSRLGRSRDARLSVATVAADAMRNQAPARMKLTLKR